MSNFLKKLLLLCFCTVFFASCSNLKQSPLELLIIHIHGDWCRTCGRVDTVIHDAAKYFKNKKNMKYLIFDETNPQSLKETAKLARKYNLEELFENERHTGEVLYIDPDSKEVLVRYYDVADAKQYIKAAEDLIAGKEVPSIKAQRREYYLSKPKAEVIKKAKLFVIDIHHDMCGGCSITAPVFEEVAKDYTDNQEVCFFTFDLTTPETVKETRELAQELDIEKIYNGQKHTGEVLFVNPESKEIIATLILEKDKDKYHKCIKEILKGMDNKA